MKGAVYNENDPAAAAWLRELIANNLIAPGDVDERSIKDVRADDYRGYVQVHGFAGIGCYSAALRRSGWEDARPICSASVPCQPFSAAGKGLGFDDPRHLLPEWVRLLDEALEQGLPWAHVCIGEQVASAGLWLDSLRTQMEDRGYAFGVADIPAAGFAQGAHIRQRLYWVADRHDPQRWADLAGGHFGDWPQAGRIEGYGESGTGHAAGGMADGDGQDWSGRRVQGPRESAGSGAGEPLKRSAGLRENCGMVDCYDGRFAQREERDSRSLGGPDWQAPLGSDADRPDRVGGLGHHHQGPPLGSLAPDERGAIRVEGPTLGAAGSLLGCDWLLCHDARIRPVESGTFPLAPSHPGRLGLLRGFGNGLDLETAVNFISAYMEAAEIKALMSELT